MDKLRSEKRLQHRPSNWLGSSLAYILCYRVIIMKTKWAFLCKIMFILFFSSTKWYSWANNKNLVLCLDNNLWSGWRLPWSHMWCHFTVKLKQKKRKNHFVGSEYYLIWSVSSRPVVSHHYHLIKVYEEEKNRSSFSCLSVRVARLAAPKLLRRPPYKLGEWAWGKFSFIQAWFWFKQMDFLLFSSSKWRAWLF